MREAHKKPSCEGASERVGRRHKRRASTFARFYASRWSGLRRAVLRLRQPPVGTATVPVYIWRPIIRATLNSRRWMYMRLLAGPSSAFRRGQCLGHSILDCGSSVGRLSPGGLAVPSGIRATGVGGGRGGGTSKGGTKRDVSGRVRPNVRAED
jgi:hypothetical protein